MRGSGAARAAASRSGVMPIRRRERREDIGGAKAIMARRDDEIGGARSVRGLVQIDRECSPAEVALQSLERWDRSPSRGDRNIGVGRGVCEAVPRIGWRKRRERGVNRARRDAANVRRQRPALRRRRASAPHARRFRRRECGLSYAAEGPGCSKRPLPNPPPLRGRGGQIRASGTSRATFVVRVPLPL